MTELEIIQRPENENLFNKLKKINFTFCVISAIFLSIGFGSLLILSNFNIYIISYVHNKEGQEYVSLIYGNLMPPILTFAMVFFSSLSGIIEKKIGPKITIVLGEIIIIIFLALFYFFNNNIWQTYIIFFGIGFGYSIIYFIPVKNLCFYYPKNKGIISAFIVSLKIFFFIVFNIIGKKIINPDEKPTDGGFYPLDISENYKKLVIFIGIITILGTVLSILFFIKYEPYFDRKTETQNETESENSINNNKIIKGEKNAREIKIILKNYRIWIISLIAAFCIYPCIFIFSSLGTFFSLNQTSEEDEKFIYLLIFICLFILGPIWGLINDKFGFRIAIIILTILGILDNVGFIFFLDKNLYKILICVTCVISSGILASFNPHIMEVFGIKYVLELNGILGLFLGLSSLGGAVTSIIFGIIWENESEIINPYKIVFIVGIGLNILAFILQWFDSNDEFDFGIIEKIREIKKIHNSKLQSLTTSSFSSSDSNY